MIKVPDFTKDEIDYILDKANFTDQQHTLFMLRNKECSYEMARNLCKEKGLNADDVINQIKSKFNN